MDAKQILKELMASIEIGYRQIRHNQINTWIDKAIKAAYEKSGEKV